MSLWKNNDGPKSAPVWYARHCVFDGVEVANNKINLKNSNTSFDTGDCVVYYSTTPIGGLSNEGVYYLRKAGNEYFVCSTRALAKNPEGESISITATEESSKQVFIKFDNAVTSVSGTEVPAVVAVDKATAQLRVGGIVSPGWYRYKKYTDSNNRNRINLELLAGVKTMTLTPQEKYTATIKGYSASNPDKWTFGDRFIGITITPIVDLSGKSASFKVKLLNANRNLKNLGFTFTDTNEEGANIPYDDDGYLTLTKTITSGQPSQPVSFIIYNYSGNIDSILLSSDKTISASLVCTIDGKEVTASTTFEVTY